MRRRRTTATDSKVKQVKNAAAKTARSVNITIGFILGVLALYVMLYVARIWLDNQ